MTEIETYLVTGASSGIGDATSRRLLDNGHRVISLDICEPTAPVTAHQYCDLGNTESIDRAVAALKGSFHSLLNVAGVSDQAGPELAVRVNILGLRYLTESVWNRILDGGTVVSVSSIAGNNWRKRRTAIQEMLDISDFDSALNWWRVNSEMVGIDAYSLSKEAVVMYTMALAGRGLKRGIRVNDIGPGPVETRLLPEFTKAVGSDQMQKMVDIVGRPAQAGDIADVLVVLAEGKLKWLNGQHVLVDGGLTAGYSSGWA